MSQPATFCEQSVGRLAIKTWTSWSKNYCCIGAGGDTNILALSCASIAVTGLSMFKSPPPYPGLHLRGLCYSCCFFPQTSFELFLIWLALSLYCLRTAYFTTRTAGRRVWCSLFRFLFLFVHFFLFYTH